MCPFVSALHDGQFVGYSIHVLDQGPLHPETSMTPFLHGFTHLAGLNAWFDSRIDKLHCVFEGTYSRWFVGIRTFQCVRSPPGHWLLGVGHCDDVGPRGTARVHKDRFGFPVP